MKQLTFIFITFIFFLALSLVSQSAFAQTKSHFVLKQNGEVIQNQAYFEAVNLVNLDEFRFMTLRRVLPIEGTGFVVELLSAQELLETYQKPISPFTKPNNQDGRQVSFIAYPEGNIKLNVVQ